MVWIARHGEVVNAKGEIGISGRWSTWALGTEICIAERNLQHIIQNMAVITKGLDRLSQRRSTLWIWRSAHDIILDQACPSLPSRTTTLGDSTTSVHFSALLAHTQPCLHLNEENLLPRRAASSARAAPDPHLAACHHPRSLAAHSFVLHPWCSIHEPCLGPQPRRRSRRCRIYATP